MTAKTIKGPARRELVPLEAIDWPILPVEAVCPHGDRWLVAPSAIGTPCWRDGKPLRVRGERLGRCSTSTRELTGVPSVRSGGGRGATTAPTDTRRASMCTPKDDR